MKMMRNTMKPLWIPCVVTLFLFTLPAFSEERPATGSDWKKGHITEVGKDYLKIDKVRYRVSPLVVITGIAGDTFSFDVRRLRSVDQIMFRVNKTNAITEIRVLRIAS